MLDFLLIVGALLSTLLPLGYQGFLTLKERRGYRKNPKYKDHPELRGVRKGDKMLIVKFQEGKIENR